jgi:hypothetical protein
MSEPDPKTTLREFKEYVENCKPFLEAAEIGLVAAKCGHPSDTLVFLNP